MTRFQGSYTKVVFPFDVHFQIVVNAVLFKNRGERQARYSQFMTTGSVSAAEGLLKRTPGIVFLVDPKGKSSFAFCDADRQEVKSPRGYFSFKAPLSVNY
jgi:hypothetical protein